MRHSGSHAFKLILVLFILGNATFNIHACTIFYLTNDSLILAGNNEDWKDPFPKMWFIPGQNGKLGWIKFGWGSGFPQGGMNEEGLFWDATSGPYLEMPWSELNKEKFEGALMQKVIEECSSVEEAIRVFSAYYCEDQYRAQYLLGDAEFQSIIVEGDSILFREGDHQILTNFYQSHPELGGYPCWRYDLAEELIQECEKVTPYLAGTILSATHQEGNYPTQYSQIYDLRNKQIILFYYHHYEEYIIIDLNDELSKGARSYDVPSLFAGTELVSPESGESVTGSSYDFAWKGRKGFMYELIYSADPGFSDEYTMKLSVPSGAADQEFGIIFGSAGLFILLLLVRKNIRARLMGVGLLLAISQIQCSSEEVPEIDNRVLMTFPVNDLKPDIVYYWKVKAYPAVSHDFESETTTRSFTTAGSR